MHRLLLVALGIALAAIVVLQFGGSASSATPAVQGDADCDGTIAQPDLIRVLAVLAGDDTTPGCDLSATDLDCDGDTGTDDALGLLFYFGAIPGPTPVPGCPTIGSPAPTPGTLTPTGTDPTETPPDSATPTQEATQTATPENTPEPTPPPPFCPAGVPTASPQAHIPVATAPAPNGYHLLQLMECEHFIVPTDFTPIPGRADEALISTQEGLVWRVSMSGQFEPTLAADLRDRVMRISDEGLLSITFQPGNDDFVYVNYNTGSAYDSSLPKGAGSCGGGSGPLIPALPNPPDPKRSVVARFPFANNELTRADQVIVLEIKRPHCWHSISQLAFDPRPGQQDILYIGSGDGGGIGSKYDDHENPLNNLLGVILRVRIRNDGSYEVPADNPFIGVSGAKPEIWANEFRHPWRVTVDPATGDVWTGDVGQQDWEEVDRVERGANYGWNKMEGNHCYPPPLTTPTPTPTATPTASPSPCFEAGMTLPVAEYSHYIGCAIAVGYVYRGNAMPELGGYLIYGDFCSGRIWALNTASVDDTPIELYNSPEGIVSLGQTADRELVILDKDGAIFQLVRN